MGNTAVPLFAQDGMTLLAMFWFAVVLEVPRFLIASFYLVSRELLSRKPAYNAPAAGAMLQRVPKISVLLPGHNEGPSLERAIRGLNEQTLRPDQIVIIDDGSTDNMASVGHSLRARGLVDVFISTGLRGGKSAAHNLGLTYCTGDIIVIADIDTTFDRDALERIIEPFADGRVGAVSGNLGVRNADASMLSRFQTIQYITAIGLGRRVNDMLFGLFIASGAFSAFRRDALAQVGGWAAGPGEDGDMSTRLRRAGWEIRFQPDAWALTDVPTTLSAFLRQRARWNRSFVMLRLRKHIQIMNPFNSNFSLRDAVATLDALFFEAFRPMMFIGYATWLIARYGMQSLPIFAFVTALYMVAGIAMFVMASLLAGDYGHRRLLVYVPGSLLFNALIQRPAIVYAHFTELLFRRGYKDSFVPGRILKRIDQY